MRVLYVSLLVVIVDQISKLSVKGFSIPFLNINYKGMFEGQRINVIGNFFRITFVENPGMAFGIDPGIDWKLWISIFSLIASIALIIYLYVSRNQSILFRLSLALILGGAVGNLIDRLFYGIFYNYAPLFYGKVVDFFDFDFFNITFLGKSYDRWPVFNIADSAVTIGVLMLILFYRKVSKEESQEAASELQALSSNINEAQNNSNENLDYDSPDKGKEISL